MAAQYVHQHKTRRQSLNAFMNRIGNFLLDQWAVIITSILGLLVFIALSIPFLSYFGLDSIAKPLFYALHYVCAQIPSHSFYIFGHQLGLCARNFSIYASMFLTSLVFVLSKKRLPGIPWWVWVLMILPMALDGTTQMFGLRESNAILRVVTGTLFGVGCIWFALPLMQKSILETTPAPYMVPRPFPAMAQPILVSQPLPLNGQEDSASSRNEMKSAQPVPSAPTEQ